MCRISHVVQRGHQKVILYAVQLLCHDWNNTVHIAACTVMTCNVGRVSTQVGALQQGFHNVSAFIMVIVVLYKLHSNAVQGSWLFTINSH